MIQIKVVGYYDHFNLGDEQYKVTFTTLFDMYIGHGSYDICFIDVDKIASFTFTDNDIIVVGGGDILNDYFLDKVSAKLTKSNNLVIALSVGLPYISTLKDTFKLQIFDYIFLRTKQDLDIFGQYFSIEKVYYFPDISYLLMKNERTLNFNDAYYQRLISIKNRGKRIVSLALSRHFHSEHYYNILNDIVAIISRLHQKNYHLVFVPFNTNLHNDKENDTLFQRDVIEKLLKASQVTMSDVTFINETLSPEHVLELYKLVDISIPMRFHAVLFSVYSRVPIIPIFTTRKILNLLLDIKWYHGYQCKVDKKDKPINIDVDVFMSRFNHLEKTINDNAQALLTKLDAYVIDIYFTESCNMLNDIFKNKIKTTTVINTPLVKIQNKIQHVYDIVQRYANEKGYNHFTEVIRTDLQDVIVNVVSYFLTNGCPNSKYNFGLKTKMFSAEYDYKAEWEWIIRDLRNGKEVTSNPQGLFNLTYIDQQDYSGCHRSGWQYVYENLIKHNNANSNLLLDLYVDRTFHWNKEFNKVVDLIPYTKPWIGFIHHTFEESFSEYNCYNLLRCPEFISSLDHCRALFVLSKDLQVKLKTALKEMGRDTLVFALVHPTDTSDIIPRFSYSKFLSNPDKKLLHVGGWLRNTYSFYNLNMPSEIPLSSSKFSKVFDAPIQKVAVKGKNMSNYFPLPTFSEDLRSILIHNMELHHSNILSNISANISSNVSGNISSNVSCGEGIVNNWNKLFFESVQQELSSVKLIEYLDNTNYDSLLTENVVFVNLIDASAVNTLIECVTRHTPIIVNNHPAVVELLGKDYPLFYNHGASYFELSNSICKILSNPLNIRNAYRHLKAVDKSKYDIEHFVNTFCNIVRTLH